MAGGAEHSPGPTEVYGTADQLQQTIGARWPDMPDAEGLLYFLLLRRLRGWEQHNQTAGNPGSGIGPADYLNLTEGLLRDCRSGVDSETRLAMPLRLCGHPEEVY